jgi:hypothetical protein
MNARWLAFRLGAAFLWAATCFDAVGNDDAVEYLDALKLMALPVPGEVCPGIAAAVSGRVFQSLARRADAGLPWGHRLRRLPS